MVTRLKLTYVFSFSYAATISDSSSPHLPTSSGKFSCIIKKNISFSLWGMTALDNCVHQFSSKRWWYSHQSCPNYSWWITSGCTSKTKYFSKGCYDGKQYKKISVFTFASLVCVLDRIHLVVSVRRPWSNVKLLNRAIQVKSEIPPSMHQTYFSSGVDKVSSIL